MATFLTGAGLAAACGFNAWAAWLVFAVTLHVFPDMATGALARALASGPLTTVAAVGFAVEFFADKIPFVDRFLHLVNTLLRPLAGAALAAAAVAPARPGVEAASAVFGAAAALLAHLARNASRFASTAAVSGISQFVVSLAEDVVAIGIAAVSLFSPGFSIPVVFALLVLVVLLFGRVRQAAAVLFLRATHPRRHARGESESRGRPKEEGTRV